MAADVSKLENARTPSEIPRSGWKDIAYRVKNEIAADNLSIISAGVAFYGFLAIFPALAALVSIYGLITDPASLQRHISSVQSVLPAEAAKLVNDQLLRIIQSRQASLGWSVAIGILIALWSAAKGMSSIFAAMNVAYDEPETRGFIKISLLALALTFASIVFLIVFLFIIVGVPLVLHFLIADRTAAAVLTVVRWPLLAVAGIAALAVLYRYGPNRKEPRWQWVSWGAVIATALWLAGSALFSVYVANFGSYDATYGSLGVVVVLMTWLLLSAYCVLLGAEINAEIEDQIKSKRSPTARQQDSSRDKVRRMG